MAELPVLTFASKEEWDLWLEEHHSSDGLWVKLAKKNSGVPSVTYDEAVETALCYGWIDGQMKGLDDTYYLQRFTPRRSRSKWSKINVGKAEDLIAQGKMRPAGLEEIARAKADGRWAAAYDSSSNAKVPPDLTAALRKNPAAKKAFDGLSSSLRYSVIYRIQDAKKPETRARRIDRFVTELAETGTIER